MRKLKILFDFDGTVCGVETIPHVASLMGISEYQRIKEMTDAAASSENNYEINFRERIKMMEAITIDDFIRNVPVSLFRSDIVSFIKAHREICEIVSCNLDCWCIPITSFLGIPCRFSKAMVSEGHVIGIKEILNKKTVIENYQKEGYLVVFIGDSANDLEALRQSDFPLLLSSPTPELSFKLPDIITISPSSVIPQLKSYLQSIEFEQDSQ